MADSANEKKTNTTNKPEVNFTKKIPADIYNFVRAFKPDLPKNTHYHEAWEIISENGALWFSLYAAINPKKIEIEIGNGDDHITSLYYDHDEIYLPKARCMDDFDWNFIYKEVFDYVIKNKLIKKPRKKRTPKK